MRHEVSGGSVGTGRAEVNTLPDLVALRAVSNGALKGATLPSRIKIFNWGENPSTKGTITVGNKSAELLAANQRRLGFERVALDYNHCSVPGSEEGEKLLKAGQPPIIFGYGRPNLVKGDGLYLEEMEYTPLGIERARNFEDLSPAAASECGQVDFIHSVALTTNGCLYDVTFFSANRSGAESTTKDTKDTKTDFMSTQNNDGLVTLALVAGAMGLAATAGEAEVAAKMKQLCALEPLKDLVEDGKVTLLSALEAPDFVKGGKLLIVDTVNDINTRLKAVETAGTKSLALLSATVDGKTVTMTGEDVLKLAARISLIETTIKEQATAGAEVERGKILQLFAAAGKAPKDADGKAYTAEELKRLDVPVLKLLYANTPATVPMSARAQAVRDGKGIDPKLKGRARFEVAQELENSQKS